MYSEMSCIISCLHARRANRIPCTRASISGLFKKEIQTKETMMESGGKEAVLWFSRSKLRKRMLMY